MNNQTKYVYKYVYKYIITRIMKSIEKKWYMVAFNDFREYNTGLK